jgi:hypothetical protein
MAWTEYVTLHRGAEEMLSYNILIGKPEGKRLGLLMTPASRRDDNNIKM